MRIAILGLAALCLMLAACGDPPPPASDASTNVLHAADYAGFARADAPRPFSFPADHGPHPDYRDEWWYVTGNLDGPNGRRFGFQITFFRHGLKRPMPPRASHWAGQDIAMAHFAISDVANRRYTSFQRLSRAAVGLAGVQAAPFKVWLDDWAMQAGPNNGFPWHLRAQQDGVVLDLELNPQKPPVLNGDHGLSHKSAEPGNASYYYSITRMAAKGKITLPDEALGQALSVSGTAWLDREWSTSMLAEYQAGWDWFALQLNDGTELMYFRLRNKDGKDDPASAGTLVAADGSYVPLPHEEVDLQAWDSWETADGVRYPAGWRIKLKTTGRELEIRPVLADQEFHHSTRYWEGAVDVVDAATGNPAGRGYVELTGYAPGRIERSGE
jgi:predicted secreted hydrolase